MIRRILTIFLALLAVLVLGRIALAQLSSWELVRQSALLPTAGSALPSFLQRSAAQNVDPGLVSEILKGAQILQARGLPTTPYLLKANEALAKGVSPSEWGRGLARTKNQTELAGRLVDRAIAGGGRLGSLAVRRKVVQQFQWALLNGHSPRELMALTGGKADLSEIGKSVSELNKSQSPGVGKGVEPKGEKEFLPKKKSHEAKKEKKPKKKEKWKDNSKKPGTTFTPGKKNGKENRHNGRKPRGKNK